MKFTLTNPHNDFGIKNKPEINPQIGDNGIILKETEKGYFVRFNKYTSRDYYLYKDEVSIDNSINQEK